MVKFIKACVLGGILFLIPVALLLVLFGHAHKIVAKLAGPIVESLPVSRVFGLALTDLISVLVLLIVCFLAGLLALTPQAMKFVAAIESVFLSKVPAYDVAKMKLTTPLRFEEAGKLRPVLVRLDDQSQIGFEIERGDDSVVVYFPGAPDPWSGAVAVVAEERVSVINATTQAAIIVMKQLGKGTGKLLSA